MPRTADRQRFLQGMACGTQHLSCKATFVALDRAAHRDGGSSHPELPGKKSGFCSAAGGTRSSDANLQPALTGDPRRVIAAELTPEGIRDLPKAASGASGR